MFNRVAGINVAEFEFPAYFNFFILRKQVRLICTEQQVESVLLFHLLLCVRNKLPLFVLTFFLILNIAHSQISHFQLIIYIFFVHCYLGGTNSDDIPGNPVGAGREVLPRLSSILLVLLQTAL